MKKLRCYFGLCKAKFHDTPFGCGGKCIDCGKIFGWMTNEELRGYSSRLYQEQKYENK